MALPVFISHFKKMKLKDLVIVSPDAGGVERARLFARKLNADLAIADKKRTAPNVAELMHIIGDVENKNAIIVDDIIDTAGTLCATINALKKKGAKKVFAACTHGIFSGQALERINAFAAGKDLRHRHHPPALHGSRNARKSRCCPLPGCSPNAIESIHKETSVSKLFLIK